MVTGDEDDLTREANSEPTGSEGAGLPDGPEVITLPDGSIEVVYRRIHEGLPPIRAFTQPGDGPERIGDEGTGLNLEQKAATIADPGATEVASHRNEFEDDAWLDDYEEGSTSEEVLERVKKGMLFWHPDTPPEVIARQVVEHFGLADDGDGNNA